MTLDDLRKICPYGAGRVDAFVIPLAQAMLEFEINTARRQAAFIAQIAHETGEFRYLREIASGVEYEPGTALGKEVGNTQPGDGTRYKGGGCLQITGRFNYDACGKALGVNLLDSPSLVEVPAYASRSAAWYWSTHKLNDLADGDKFGALTKTINGGYNGLDSRISYWLRARQVLGL